jgi:hypothetical protein
MVFLAGALGLSLWARYGLIESISVATLCNATSVPISCTVRDYVIATTILPLWGYIALATGAIAVFSRRFDLTVLALVTGAIGLVLYAGATAAVGFLLGWITLARLIVRGRPAMEL